MKITYCCFVLSSQNLFIWIQLMRMLFADSFVVFHQGILGDVMVHVHVDNRGQLKQDNCLYSRVTQWLAHYIVWDGKIKSLHYSRSLSHQFRYVFDHINIFFHMYGFFVIASWRCWGTWLQNRSIHMHNRWVHECRGRPAASGVCNRQWKSFSIHWPLCFFFLSQLFFFYFCVKTLSITVRTWKDKNSTSRRAVCLCAVPDRSNKPGSCPAPLSFSLKTKLKPEFI